MTDNSRDTGQEETDEYIERLRKKAGSGGCTEMWEAAQDLRETKRRGFLAGVAGSLLFGVNAASVVAAEDVDIPNEPETSVEKLDKQETRKILRPALADDDLKRIQSKLVSEGFIPDYGSTRGFRARYEEEEYRTLRITFESKRSQGKDASSGTRSDEQDPTKQVAGILWNEHEEVDPYGYITESRKDTSASVSTDVEAAMSKVDTDLSSVETTPVTIEHTNVLSEGTGVTTETNARTVPLATDVNSELDDDEISTQGIGDCACTALLGNNPLTACAPCGTVDTGCVAQIANNHAVEIAACGTCVGSAGWVTASCAACVAAVIEQNSDGWHFCCWCDLGGPLL
ncbi:hypothetical protein [Natrinema thermotolerans]